MALEQTAATTRSRATAASPSGRTHAQSGRRAQSGRPFHAQSGAPGGARARALERRPSDLAEESAERVAVGRRVLADELVEDLLLHLGGDLRLLAPDQLRAHLRAERRSARASESAGEGEKRVSERAPDGRMRVRSWHSRRACARVCVCVRSIGHGRRLCLSRTPSPSRSLSHAHSRALSLTHSHLHAHSHTHTHTHTPRNCHGNRNGLTRYGEKATVPSALAVTRALAVRLSQ
jgi:hypothetical protein